jgi:hypothetical protein
MMTTETLITDTRNETRTCAKAQRTSLQPEQHTYSHTRNILTDFDVGIAAIDCFIGVAFATVEGTPTTSHNARFDGVVQSYK